MSKRANAAAPRRGVIYGRQSRTKDGSESLATQLEACRQAAEHFGIEVVAELLEPPSTSAYKKRGRAREMWPKLLEMIEDGSANVAIGYKSDRFSRGGGPGWAPLLEAAEEAGLDLDTFVLTPSGFMSEFEIGIRATMDREESKKTSDRLIDMKERHASEGRPSGGGNRAYGYERDGITVIESEAEIYRECVARYLGGESVRSLANWLNEAGHPTATGRKWLDGTLRNVLVNPRYAGFRTHRGAIVGDAVWPALIDRPTWERLTARIKARATGSGGTPSKYLLSRVTSCSKCGGRMNGAPVEGRPRYRCHKAPGKVNCGSVTIAADPVEELVVGMVLYRLDSPVVADALAGRTKVHQEDDDITDQILRLEAKLDENAQMWRDDEISRKEYVTNRRHIEDKLEALRVRISTRERVHTIASFLAEGEDLRSLWDDLPLARRHEILKALIDKVVIHPAKVRGSRTVDLDRVEVVWRV
jgi:site-specific DNA recombinase